MSEPDHDLRQGLIGLGANLGDPRAHIETAVLRLRSLGGLEVLWVSPLIETAPVDCPGVQPDYLNGVLCFRSNRAPEWLLGVLHAIEARAGRDRAREGHHGARPLDLDLLCLGDLTRNRPGLTLPHKRFEERAFVLQPLAAMDPDWPLPSGSSAAQGLARLFKADPAVLFPASGGSGRVVSDSIQRRATGSSPRPLA